MVSFFSVLWAPAVVIAMAAVDIVVAQDPCDCQPSGCPATPPAGCKSFFFFFSHQFVKFVRMQFQFLLECMHVHDSGRPDSVGQVAEWPLRLLWIA
jgi:hypothetical protein